MRHDVNQQDTERASCWETVVGQLGAELSLEKTHGDLASYWGTVVGHITADPGKKQADRFSILASAMAAREELSRLTKNIESTPWDLLNGETALTDWAQLCPQARLSTNFNCSNAAAPIFHHGCQHQAFVDIGSMSPWQDQEASSWIPPDGQAADVWVENLIALPTANEESLGHPTFYKDIPSILHANALTDVAPMLLLPFPDARTRSRTIRSKRRTGCVSLLRWLSETLRASLILQLRYLNDVITDQLRRFTLLDVVTDIVLLEIPWFLIHGSHPPAGDLSVCRNRSLWAAAV